MSVTLVAAVSRNGVIGAAGAMPWHLPEDFRHFKALTMGHAIVMGRKTFQSIGRVLPGRRSIVITRQAGWKSDGVTVARSVREALDLAGDVAMVIGGGEIFAQTIDFADALEITEVDAEVSGDTRFPAIDPAAWIEVARDDRNGFAFVSYRRSSGAPE